jgi:hypothetical protein
MIYGHYEFFEDFPSMVDSSNIEEWEFMMSEDILDLPELDSIKTNPPADKALGALKATDDGMRIVVFQDDAKIDPVYGSEDTDFYDPGLYSGYIIVFEMADDPQYVCEALFEFENLIDPAFSQSQLEQDFEDQFMKTLKKFK